MTTHSLTKAKDRRLYYVLPLSLLLLAAVVPMIRRPFDAPTKTKSPASPSPMRSSPSPPPERESSKESTFRKMTASKRGRFSPPLMTTFIAAGRHCRAGSQSDGPC